LHPHLFLGAKRPCNGHFGLTREARINELEAEIGIYQEEADRAEQWLDRGYTEIEDRFLRQDNGRRGVPQRTQSARSAR
jgi:hypothetical protein